MRTGGSLSVTNQELEQVRDEIRRTIATLDNLIARRRHLRLVEDQDCSRARSVVDHG